MELYKNGKNFEDVVKAHDIENIVVAEIGVNRGRTINKYSDYVKERNGKIYAVDWFLGQIQLNAGELAYKNPGAWKTGCAEKELEGFLEENAETFYSQFYNNLQNKDIITILQGKSVDMAENIPDKSLDVCFIDATHDYLGVMADIEAYLPKVKNGGTLCFDDYDLPFAHRRDFREDELKTDCVYSPRMHHPGVIKAVNDSFTQEQIMAEGRICYIKIYHE